MAGNPSPNMTGLRPARPGEVRNPLGINDKSKRFTQALVKLIEDGGLEEEFVKAGLDKATKGKGKADFKFWEFIYNRIEGKLAEKVEASVTHTDGNDAEFDHLIAAYRGNVSLRPAGGNGALESSGTSSSGESGQVGDGASPQVDRPEVPGIHEGHRENGVSSNGAHGPSETRKE